MGRKAKEESFDFIRAVSTIGIVLFHNSFNYIEYSIGGNPFVFQKYGNGDWGGLFVAVFFMLSGAVLWYNYEDRLNVGEFYVKRWLAIFPMFYVAWAVQYCRNAHKFGTWLWGGPRKQFLMTFFGMDGYFMHRGLNYYCLGEWFLGAIILLYVMFPLLRILYKNKNLRILTTILIAVFYTLNLYRDWFIISDGKNLLTCLMDFWIGMILVTYKERLKNLPAVILSFVLMVVVMIAPVPIKEVMCSTLTGASMFILLMNAAAFVQKYKLPQKFIKMISKYSFAIFLVHHVILYIYMEPYAGMEIGFVKSILMFLFITFVIVLIAALLTETVGLATGAVRQLLFHESGSGRGRGKKR